MSLMNADLSVVDHAAFRIPANPMRRQVVGPKSRQDRYTSII